MKQALPSRPSCRLPVAGITIALLLLASSARAEVETDKKQHFFSIDAWLNFQNSQILSRTGITGMESYNYYRRHCGWGFTTLYRFGIWEAGLGMDYYTVLFGPLYLHYSGLGRISYDISWLNVEALLEVGMHSITDIDTGFLYTGFDTGRTKLPYAGARLGLTARVPLTKCLRVILGFWALARYDVTHRDIKIYDRNCKVGGSTYGLAVRFGVDF